MPRIPLPSALACAPFTYAHGLSAGLGRERLRGTDMHRPFHGIRTSEAPESSLELAHAVLPRLPKGAYFCSITAAILTGVPLPPWFTRDRDLHIAIPASGRALRVSGVKGHVFHVGSDSTTEVCGLPVSSPEQLWRELGTVLALEDLVAAGDHLVHWRHPVTSRSRLAATLAASPQRRGRVVLRQALELLDPLAESPQESRLRVLLTAEGLAGLESNVPVRTSSGHSYRIDLALRTERVAIEYQGEYHNDPTQFRRDMTRRTRLEADQWVVVWVNADDLLDAKELAQRIRSTLDSARNR
jgi:very-short-patch-repair endonuclease